MRPGIHATVLRSRHQRHRRHYPPGANTFSTKRFLILVFLGFSVLIPGIALSVIGFQPEEKHYSEDQKKIYRVLGPSAVVCSVGLLFAASFYCYCYLSVDSRLKGKKQESPPEKEYSANASLKNSTCSENNTDPDINMEYSGLDYSEGEQCLQYADGEQ